MSLLPFGSAPTPVFTSTKKGSVPASGGGTVNYLRADGTWHAPTTYVVSPGDINETTFTLADNQVSAANVTGLAFSNTVVRSFKAIVSIVRGSTYVQFELNGVQKASTWEMSQSIVGDSVGVTFTITTAGQIQYTSTSTGSTGNCHFRASTTSV